LNEIPVKILAPAPPLIPASAAGLPATTSWMAAPSVTP
jgi:hypothetical protein